MKIKKYLIAIVDDDEDDRDILAVSFRENHDYAAVLTFESGEEFLTHLQSGAELPNIVITDLYMPMMTGMDVITQLRENPKFERIPIVLLSTIKNETIFETTTDMANIYYMVKPVSLMDYTIMADEIMAKIIPAIANDQ